MFAKRFIPGLFLLLVYVPVPTRLQFFNTSGGIYVKVNPTFYAEVSDCYLKTVEPVINTKFFCAAVCSSEPDCSLFCFDGRWCKLLSARIADYWPGYSGSDAVTFDQCYSSWADPRDLGGHVIQAAAIVDSGPTMTPDIAINGYYCKSVYSGCFLTGFPLGTPWWTADLDQKYTISGVKVQTRIAPPAEQFQMIEVFVEDISTGQSDFLAGDSGSYFNGEFVLIMGTNPLYGNRIRIRSSHTNTHLVMCEVVIYKA